MALIPHELSDAGDLATDAGGEPVFSQRLSSRELAVLVRDMPPFSGRRLTISRAPASSGPAMIENRASADAASATLENGNLRVRLDPRTGSIIELRAKGIDANLVDASGGHAINDYLYLIGDDPSDLQRAGPPRITVGERGPLVASLRVESDAPGCHALSREVRLAAGADHAELINTVDKKRIAAASYHDREGKESVNFAFPFNVPDGEMGLDVPLAVIRPEHDQMPSACKNWLTVGRWADISNRDYGITWVTLDAPLVQVGGITATLLNSQTNPDAWRKRIEPTQKLYAWAMNNHWGTNYRAYQEGPVTFRFILRPHRGTTPAEASRFATGLSQPLVALPGRGAAPGAAPLIQIDPPEVLVTALKPSDDGRALILRLLGASAKPSHATLTWPDRKPGALWFSDTSERPVRKLEGPIPVPSWGLVTVRAELAE